MSANDDKAYDDGPQALYVANAGLVLVSPFLPALFQQLGLLTESGTPQARIEGVEGTSRAVHLLQYLVDGHTAASAPTLVLNKLLSGVPIEQAIKARIEINDQERATCDPLLEAVTARMPMMKNASVSNLSQTLLQRSGRLSRTDKCWHLHVDRRSMDVLIDRLAWTFSIVHHPFMIEPVYVTW